MRNCEKIRVMGLSLPALHFPIMRLTGGALRPQALRNVSKTLDGGKALHQALREAHPAWVLNQRRVKKLCRVADISFNSRPARATPPDLESIGPEDTSYVSSDTCIEQTGSFRCGGMRPGHNNSLDDSGEGDWELVRRSGGADDEGDDDEEEGFIMLTSFA